jgi:hypothetical protein
MRAFNFILLLFSCLFLNGQVHYINTSFENASPVQWSVDSNNVVTVELIYDHERSSINRANGHWHFMVEAKKGDKVTIVLKNFDNIWNRQHASPVTDKTNSLASADGRNWKILPSEHTKDSTLRFVLNMDSSSMYVASVEPYRISDLEALLTFIKSSPVAQVDTIGFTVEGRPLEMIRLGMPGERKSVVIRARAHAWEAGGNWVAEGLVKSLLKNDASKYLERFTVYIMPIANKDGVARGKTRFNAKGIDLNRQWDKEPDPMLAPEKAAFENWLKQRVTTGNKPMLAIDLHNDNFGNLHVNLPTEKNRQYVANMRRLDSLLRKYTWYTEGISHVKNPGSFGEGMAARYGIDACVYEFNYDWIEGLKKDPTAKDWLQLGANLREVFYDYFK